MRMLCLQLLVSIALISTSCGVRTMEYELGQTGILDQHPIIQAPVTKSFFISVGDIASTAASEREIQFSWEIRPGEMISTKLPYRKLRFIIEDSKDTPTVEFVFYWGFLKQGGQYPHDIRARHPNEYIQNSENLEFAQIRISQRTLDNETSLPK